VLDKVRVYGYILSNYTINQKGRLSNGRILCEVQGKERD
jgi:hypothetical protein